MAGNHKDEQVRPIRLHYQTCSFFEILLIKSNWKDCINSLECQTVITRGWTPNLPLAHGRAILWEELGLLPIPPFLFRPTIPADPEDQHFRTIVGSSRKQEDKKIQYINGDLIQILKESLSTNNL